ncbi:unnamed protein product [Nezara viridula]|uniref:Uncharacterized protein n=1 Tax=Nezara viridula TaxID=85310 RepID=A0A9P0MRT7_NEZVI|nr:unnamed protein product [Nezara viridula]
MIRSYHMLVILLIGFVKFELISALHEYRATEEDLSFLYCKRVCNGQPKNCYFKLFIERYSVLGGACLNCTFGTAGHCHKRQCVTANGRYRGMITVNRQLPAPSIQVCKGDRIIVDVMNLMHDATVSIHWHGIRQNGYPFFDGVPYVTQCPILPGTTFRYDFFVNDVGTFFYYSHIGVQKMDGVSGSLIVRDSYDSQSGLYDVDWPEHVIFVSDWYDRPASEYLPGYNHREMKQVPETFLINGKGLHYANDKDMVLPLAEFEVVEGKRFRFRLIGSIFSNCAAAVTFLDQKVLVISADGNLKFTPQLVDTVVLNSGDRFDVVLEANRPSGIYFISVTSTNKVHCNKIHQLAILRYKDNKVVDKPNYPPPPSNLGKQFNAVESNCDKSNSEMICISHLEGESNVPTKPDQSYYYLMVGLDFYYYYDEDLFDEGTYQPYNEWKYDTRFLSMINNVSFKLPEANLLSQFDEVEKLCTVDCPDMPNNKPCHCTKIYGLKNKDFYNLILYDNSDYTFMRHSFHLHGHNFHVIEQGVFPSREEKPKFLNQLMYRLREDEKSDISRKPQRDTITIPSRGYVLTRFYSDNPDIKNQICFGVCLPACL